MSDLKASSSTSFGRFTPLGITLGYMVLSLLWIPSTDWLLAALDLAPGTLTGLQSVKGLLYVLLMALLLHRALREAARRHQAFLDEQRRLNAKLSAVLESIAEAVLVRDTEGGVVLANEPGRELLAGRDAPQNGTAALEGELRVQRSLDENEQVMRTGREVVVARSFEIEGETRQFEVRKAPWRAEDGGLLGVVAVGQDVTDRVLREQAMADRQGELEQAVAAQTAALQRTLARQQEAARELERAESFYRLVFENMHEAVLLTRADGSLVWVCPNCFPIFGIPRETLAQRENIAGVLPAEAVAANRPAGGLLSREFQCPVTTPAGERRELLITCASVDIEDGKLLYTCRDVSELERMRRQEAETATVLQRIFDGIGDAVFLVDPEQRIVQRCNRAVTELLGYTPEALAGMPTEMLFPDTESYKQFARDAYPALAAAGRYRGVVRVRRRDGELLDTGVLVTPLDAADWRRGIVTIVRDISSTRRAEHAVQLIGQIATEVAAEQEFSGAVRRVLQRLCAEFEWGWGEAWVAGPAAGELSLGERWHAGAAPGDTAALGAASAALAQAVAERGEALCTDAAAPGEPQPMSEAARPGAGLAELRLPLCAIPVGAGGTVSAVLVFRPARHDAATALRLQAIEAAGAPLAALLRRMSLEQEVSATQAKIRHSRERLRALTERLHSAREDERAAIARDLHDVVGARLTRIKLDLEACEERLLRERSEAASAMPPIAGLVDATAEDLRRLIDDLRPPLLREFGLQAALEALCEDFHSETGIEVVHDLGAAEASLSAEQQTHLYRIVQEAFNNVRKHAQATRVELTLRAGEGALELAVRDNGCGIAPQARESTRSVGLVGMAERAGLIGGRLQVMRQEPAGTAVQLRLPLTGS